MPLRKLMLMLALVCIKLFVPDVGKIADHGFKGQFSFLKHAAPWLIFGGTIFGQTGIYCWYSYVDPLLTSMSGFSSGSYPPSIPARNGTGSCGRTVLSSTIHPSLSTP